MASKTYTPYVCRLRLNVCVYVKNPRVLSAGLEPLTATSVLVCRQSGAGSRLGGVDKRLGLVSVSKQQVSGLVSVSASRVSWACLSAAHACCEAVVIVK